mgnify:CR=1 FL=1
MSNRNYSLLDRFLAPATRLMEQLRFNQKAMVIGAAFMLTCGVLAGILVVRSNAEIDAAFQLALDSAPPDVSEIDVDIYAAGAHA